jgi:hypothetical protein
VGVCKRYDSMRVRESLPTGSESVIGYFRGEPKWEEYPHTPGVFARVANKGIKSRQRTGMEVRPERTMAIIGED